MSLIFNIYNTDTTKGMDRFSESFYSIESSDELGMKVKEAINDGVPTMVYFTADWCVSCRGLEKNTFSNKGLQNKIGEIQALKVDLTDNSNEDQFLIKEYSIFGPPTILFFNENGNEEKSKRKIGVVSSEILEAEIDSLRKKT
jgi:thiol:disulfide interchange protein DsbD